jgi:hypothetical protein
MARSIRSGKSTRVRSPGLRRCEARWSGGIFWVGVLLLAAITLSWFASSAQADEIEPDSVYEPEPEATPEPEPEPGPPPPAEAADGFVEPSWIPSIEVGLETFDYNVDTTVVNQINSPSWDGTQKEAERQTMFRIGGELMGPMFEDLPGSPRLFLKGGVQVRLFSSDDLFREGASLKELQRVNVPVTERQPERDIDRHTRSGFNGLILPEEFSGQGSAVTGRFQDPSWYAGLGVAFSVPIGTDRLLYIKPSVQYSLEKIDLTAALTTVDEPEPKMVDPFPCGTKAGDPPCLRKFVIHRSRADTTTTDHSVGAGLEIAVVPFRTVRPIRVAIYAEARFMWLVSSSTTRFADVNGVATYSVTRDDFGIKGGGGLRFSWVGFD